MKFEIIGSIEKQETIAIGNNIRKIKKLNRDYGTGKWRKMKGIAKIKLSDQYIYTVELHWYEAHGIGKKEYKIKKFLD
jgi:hypothetical protein